MTFRNTPNNTRFYKKENHSIFFIVARSKEYTAFRVFSNGFSDEREKKKKQFDIITHTDGQNVAIARNHTHEKDTETQTEQASHNYVISPSKVAINFHEIH